MVQYKRRRDFCQRRAVPFFPARPRQSLVAVSPQARECPALGDELGGSFASLFADYARASGPPTSADPWVDAGEFIAWLRERRLLTMELRASALMLRLRRGVPVRAIWISDDRRFLLAYRLPGARVRCFSIDLILRIANVLR